MQKNKAKKSKTTDFYNRENSRLSRIFNGDGSLFSLLGISVDNKKREGALDKRFWGFKQPEKKENRPHYFRGKADIS